MKSLKFEILDGLSILNLHILSDIWLKSAGDISESIVEKIVFNLQYKIKDEIFSQRNKK